MSTSPVAGFSAVRIPPSFSRYSTFLYSNINVNLFTGLGFRPEALLSNHVRDRSGELHDLLVLAHDVEDVQSAMVTTGIADELS